LTTTIGIDLGTQTIKVVILQDNIVVSREKNFSGFETTKVAQETIDEALKKANLSFADIQHITATGAGIQMAPTIDSKISMMSADAKAGVFLLPKARTIIDVGAEEARAMKCDDNGLMVDFVVNERCEDMGPLSLNAERASSINATCVIFGESDVVSLIHKQESKPEIARAVFDAMADRVSSMVRRLGINPEVVLIGGVAKDVGFIASLKRKLGVEIFIPEYPEFAGALGAALIAAKRAKRKKP
jgi:benzoyl-CoA reductase subunit D